MAETLSLMEFLQALLTDAGLRGDFGHDPQGTLTAHGLAGLTPADVHDALVLVQDTQTVDYSFDATTAPPPPPPAGDGHEAAVEYLARYLAGPHDPVAEQWADPDTDPADDQDHDLGGVPLGGFGAGDATGYGAGSEPADAIGGWAAAEPDHGRDDQITADLDDIGHLDDFDDVDDLGAFTSFADLSEDAADGPDGGPPGSEGA
ncbi:hypothetical protein FHX44_113557 [Pseudonocardia hierapolitana]|uniref:Uncharacterized protein n=1 Tax=Pseudonocardia hierapolitana TaxID=1128676 RepID=A0A561SRZ1_9PSEU|nr:IniB N-terminal domain-containing protein [Pseudonocardia hierapolitana]TWF77644.1 hypothetical protein FHX44_113557 [Pseudonocardia hierapolitana]